MYTVLNNALQVKGKLSLNNGQGSTAFFSDVITQQMATDNSTDPDAMTSLAFNATDKVGNTKQWGHSLSINVEATDLGTSISTNDYLMYFDQVANHYYLMKVLTVGGDRTTGYLAIDGINTAIYELGKQFPVAKTYTQANLETVVKDVYKNSPFSIRIEDDLETVIDYTVAEKTSAQAILQDLQTKYDIDVDSWIELDNSGNISERVLYFGHLGSNNGELIRYGGAKGFENMSAQEVSDTIYTKLYVVGQTDDKDATKGHIASVNNGMDYIVDDDANASLYAIGASQNQPNYLEGTITNTLLSEPRALLTWAQAQMGIFNHPRFNYTVSPMHDQIVGVGDSITVQDFHMKPMILVNSKVIQKTTSFASPETNTFVLGEFSNIFTENANKGAGVINLIKKDVTVVQEAADNARVAADEAHKQAVAAQQQAIKAQTSADGKATTFTVNSFDDLPATANEGDIAWVTLADGTHGYTYLKGKWVEDINPTMAKNITDGVNNAINTATANATKLVNDNATNINKTISDVDAKAEQLKKDQATFDTKAQGYADTALSNAKTNTATVAQQTVKDTNDALSQAKIDITNAYKNADGVVNKKIDDTATTIGSTIYQNKTASDDGISTAYAKAQQALDGFTNTVTKTDFNSTTKDLTSKVSTAQQTADSANTTIGNYKTSNDARVKAAESAISQNSNDITARVTKTDYDKATGKISGDISTLQQRADGFDATVTKVDNTATALAQVKITADGVSSIVSDPTTGLSTRVQTAEGTLNTVKSTADGAMSKASQTANQISQEITDRTKGDSNTLQSSKNFTQSTITSYDSGLQSQLTQTSNGIINTIGSLNMVIDSSLTNQADHWNERGTGKWYHTSDTSYQGITSWGFNQTSLNGDYSFVESQPIYVNTFPGNSLYVSVDVKVPSIGGTSTDYFNVYVREYDSSGNGITSDAITGASIRVVSNWTNYRKNITLNSNTNYIVLSYQMRGNGNVYVARPYIGIQELMPGAYVPGQVDNNQTILSLFKDNWSIGITDNIGAITSGIVGNTSQMSLISKNVTIDSPSTQITGTAWIKSAMIANGAIGNAQIGTAAISDAKIANLDAAKIVSGTISTDRLDVSTIFTKAISTTDATIGRTLNIASGGQITAPLNGQVWDFTGNPYYYSNSAGKAPWFQVTQSGTFKIDTSGTLQFDGQITAPDVKFGNSVQKAFYTQMADGTLGGTNKLTTSMSFGLNGLRINQDDARGASYGTGGYVFVTGHGFYTGFDQANPRFAVSSDGNVLTDTITFTGGSKYVDIQGAVVNVSSIHQELFNGSRNLYMNAGGYARIASNSGNGAKLYVNAGDITTDNPISSGNITLNTGHAIVSQDNGKMFFYGSNGNQIDLGVKSVTQSSLVSLKEHISKVTPEQLLSETLRADLRSYNFTGDDITDKHVTPMIDDVNHEMYIPNDWLSPEGTGVDTYSVIGYLIGSVKALQEQITELKANQ